ncbi:acyl carrier protein [Pelosinus baikalensis]|uniref:Acyl carrier protein n=1 Tax=Pelosinus baikalensis TaxID=2892015 RepID=A0ABS8HZV8_9FIRM|nr:acyl carrier protein [Pelosinus baikalensis]MCC5468462.1 acyl carrier protein [Pelosinus baikalensis]
MNQQIEQKVKKLLGEVLGIEDPLNEIRMDSDLIDDLAAESIDFIDIGFRLEKDFNLGKISMSDIFTPYLRDESSHDENKKLKNEKLEELKKYAHIKDDLLDEIERTKNSRALLKVKNLVYFVDWKLSNG